MKPILSKSSLCLSSRESSREYILGSISYFRIEMRSKTDSLKLSFPSCERGFGSVDKAIPVKVALSRGEQESSSISLEIASNSLASFSINFVFLSVG
jgi:hypothetical protein